MRRGTTRSTTTDAARRSHSRRLVLLPAALVLGAASARGADETGNASLAARAVAVLEKHCQGCHGSAASKSPRFDVRNAVALSSPRPNGKAALIKPGDPARSPLWKRLGVEGDMPPEPKPRPSDVEIETVRRWILDGAKSDAVPSPTRPKPDSGPPRRRQIAVRDSLDAIIKHLRSIPDEDRPFQRFFTLAVVENRRRFLGDAANDKPLEVYRSALAKAVNSLSLARDLVVPRPIDPDGTILAVDIRDLEWDVDDLWRVALGRRTGDRERIDGRGGYPYGLEVVANVDDRDRWRELEELLGESRPYLVRGDWFVAEALRPPLYYRWLRLPGTVDELETSLGVDAKKDVAKGVAARAGFRDSGISKQHRVVERHRTPHGAYWKSFDFARSDGDHDIFKRPFGPKFDGNPDAELAFDHDGGEMIFSLPNGLQGYYLANAKGERLDVAPISIVSDPRSIDNDAQIHAGVSCVSCHATGVRRGFRNEIRDNFGGELDEAKRRLLPRPAAMEKLLEKDERRFVDAMERLTGVRVKPEDAEPVYLVAKRYDEPLSFVEAAIELGYEDPAGGAAVLRATLGAGADEQIKRQEWQSVRRGARTFQKVAGDLRLGTLQDELIP